MPTILVADDNSNIQKMVKLALKGQGLEVIAVGNGEEAVRKLAQIVPDVILADIFMPVRNGYELCEFVKNEQRLEHIPVILLQGAFDPYDESKARLVRADGVLKKPFVPPGPLIGLVQTMLARSAQMRPTAATAAFDAEATVKMSQDEISALTGSGGPAVAEAPPEPEIPDYAVHPQRIEFAEGEKPLAFGDLLGAGAAPEAPVEEPLPETPSWGGIELEPKQPSPDEPPIKVEFGPAEPMELVTEESGAGVVVDSGPLPELATSAGDWVGSMAPPAQAAAATAPTPTAAPPAETPALTASLEVPTLSAPAEAAPPVTPPAIATAPVPAEAPAPEPTPVAALEPAVVQAVVAAATSVGPPGSFRAMTPLDPLVVEGIVDKVLDHLQPEMLQRVTHELLRPIVREITQVLLRQQQEKDQSPK